MTDMHMDYYPHGEQRLTNETTEQSVKVFSISEHEWFAGYDKESVITFALKEWGYAGDGAERLAKEDGCWDGREDVIECALDSHNVNVAEEGEDPKHASFRQVLREMIERKQEFPFFFCGTDY